MNYRKALKNCRPNGASAQVIAAVPSMIAALEAVDTWAKTVPDEHDLRGFAGPANTARATALQLVREALAYSNAPDGAMFQPALSHTA